MRKPVIYRRPAYSANHALTFTQALAQSQRTRHNTTDPFEDVRWSPKDGDIGCGLAAQTCSSIAMTLSIERKYAGI